MIKTIMVKTMPGRPTRGILQVGSLTIPAALGRSGIASGKREGDGKTPVASMRLLNGYWRNDRGPKPVTMLPMQPIRPGDLWCDAPTHPAYNRPVQKPFKPSHEEMRRDDHLYDICIVMDWNISQRRRYGGSAIFLHIAKPGYTPTEGCIAVSKRDMHRLLAHTGRQTHIVTR